MGYSAMFDAARTANFLKLAEIAIVACAKDITTEPTTTANHYNRVSLATRVLHSPALWVDSFKDGIAVQNVTDASLDTDFYAAVAAIWNGYAGVTYNGALI